VVSVTHEAVRKWALQQIAERLKVREKRDLGDDSEDEVKKVTKMTKKLKGEQ
jgi:hypothetical protein